MPNSAERLLEPAKAEFPDLTVAETKLMEAAAAGDIADYSSAKAKENNPEKYEAWGEARILRSAVVAWLCADRAAQTEVHHRGVLMFGARLSGRLNLSAASVPFDILLCRCAIPDGIGLMDARTRGLVLNGSGVGPITADRLNADGSVNLRDGFHVTGGVRLLGARIGGVLVCSKGRFDNKGGNALSADGAEFKGDVFLNDGFHATGEVRLLGAQIGGDLTCGKGRFENKDGDALSADRADVKGGVFLNDGFHATGDVRLLGARIGGDLDCSKGRFENKDDDALSADGVEFKGNVFLNDGFHATGKVRLGGARVGGNLECRKGRFENASGYAISAERMTVEGGFVWRELTAKPIAVNLAHGRIGVIVDDESSWPAPGHLILDGLVYDSFGGDAPTDAGSRLRWLGLQSSEPKDFRTQPYEQLIKVFRAMGQDDDANQVAIAKRIAIRANRTRLREPPKWKGDGGVTFKSVRQAFLSWIGFRLYRMWNVFLEKIAGYGYRPERLWVTLVVLLLFGAGVFTAAYRADALYPIERVRYEIDAGNPLPRAYPEFYGLVYSLDVLVPFFDLNQERYWVIRSDHSFSFFLHFYEWFHIVAGWVITGLLLASPTRLLRKD